MTAPVDIYQNAHETIANTLHQKSELAWSRHCDIAGAIMEGGLVKWKDANEAACRIMMKLFGVDTSPTYIKLLKQRTPAVKEVVGNLQRK